MKRRFKVKKVLIAVLLVIIVGALVFGGCSSKTVGPVTIKLGYDTPPTTNVAVSPSESVSTPTTSVGGSLLV